MARQDCCGWINRLPKSKPITHLGYRELRPAAAWFRFAPALERLNGAVEPITSLDEQPQGFVRV